MRLLVQSIRGISNNRTGAVIRRPGSYEIYKKAGEFMEGTIFFKEWISSQVNRCSYRRTNMSRAADG
jgi:hypothetical protein